MSLQPRKRYVRETVRKALDMQVADTLENSTVKLNSHARMQNNQ
jgi:hypothetical protein